MVGEVIGGQVEDRPKSNKLDTKTVRHWQLECDIAEKVEKAWRDRVPKILEIYRGEDKSVPFNILHSNTQTLLPAIYTGQPRPDIRRRHKDADPQSKEIAEGLERAIVYQNDSYDFDHEMADCLQDYLLAGRGVVRVAYDAAFEKAIEQKDTGARDELGQPVILDQEVENVVDEEVVVEAVDWDRFLVSPARKWRDVRWVRFMHPMTRDELREHFPDHADEIRLDWTVKGAPEDRLNDDRDEDALKRAEVWEIWDKDHREVVWIAKSFKKQPLRIDDDPLDLQEFFPLPRPLYSIQDPDSLVPTPEYDIYKDQADELNANANKINALYKALVVRGGYDASVEEFAQIFDTEDAGLVAIRNAAQFAGQAGGLNNAIWMVDLMPIIQALSELYADREQIKNVIFETTGIADIIRGATNASETATAQQIKAQFGSLRLDARKKEIARFVRDIFRIKAEIIAEKFSAKTLSDITLRDITEEQLSTFRADVPRNVRIDVETNETVANDLATEQKGITELLTSVTNFVTGMAPLVDAGIVPLEVAKSLLLSATRRFDMGREVEDALNQIGGEDQDGEPQQPQGPTPEEQAQQQALQLQQQQVEQQAQVDQAKQQAEMQKIQLQMEADQRRHENEMAKIEAERVVSVEEVQLRRELVRIKREEAQIKKEERDANRLANAEG